jgi:hypothetical protein
LQPLRAAPEGAAIGRDTPGRYEFVDQLAVLAALKASDGIIDIHGLVRSNSFAQAGPAITESVVEIRWGPG